MSSLQPNGHRPDPTSPSSFSREASLPSLPTSSSQPSSSTSRPRSSSNASNSSSSSNGNRRSFGFAFIRDRRQSGANVGLDAVSGSASGSGSRSGGMNVEMGRSDEHSRQQRDQIDVRAKASSTLAVPREKDQEVALSANRSATTSSSKRMSRAQPTSLESFKAQQSMKLQQQRSNPHPSSSSSSSRRELRPTPPMSSSASFTTSRKPSRSTDADRTSTITYPPRNSQSRPHPSSSQNPNNRQSLPTSGRERRAGSTMSISASPYTVYQPQNSAKQQLSRSPQSKSPLSPTFPASSFPSSTAPSSSSITSSPAPSMLKGRRSAISLTSSSGAPPPIASPAFWKDTNASESGFTPPPPPGPQIRRPSWVSIRLPSLSAASNASFSRSSQGTITGFSTGSSEHAFMSSGGEGDGRGRYELRVEDDDDKDEDEDGPGGNLMGAPLPSPSHFGSFPPPSPSTEQSPSRSSPSSSLPPSRPPPAPPTMSSPSASAASHPLTASPLEADPPSSIPALPARHPLRPRTRLDSPSRESSSNSGSVRSVSTFSEASASSVREGSDERQFLGEDMSGSSTTDANWTTSDSLSRPSSMAVGGGKRRSGVDGPDSVWLDDDEDEGSVEGDLARYKRRESTRDTSGDGEKRTTRMSVNSRANSTRSGMSDAMKAKRREARITSTYFSDEEGEDIDFAALQAQSSSQSGDQELGAPFLFQPSPRGSPSCPSFASLAISQGHPLDHLLQPSQPTTDRRSSPTHANPNAPVRSISSVGTGGRGPSPSHSAGSHSRSKSHSVLQRAPSSTSIGPNPSPSISRAQPVAEGSVTRTKRAHLIHEIYSTERSYAQDLALVRDAYLSRFRPLSTVIDGSSEAGASSSPRTSSIRTFETVETSAWAGSEGPAGDRKSKSSLMSNGGTIPARNGGPSVPSPGLASPISFVGGPPPSAYTPSSASTVSDNPLASPSGQSRISQHSSYFPSFENTVTSPARSSTMTSASSQMGLSHSVSMIGLGGAGGGGSGPVGPLSAGDVRAVFLNLESLASLSDEFARELLYVEENVEENVGENMVGETFLTMLPRLKQAYVAYCPRQAGAQVRYTQLAADSRFSSYFSDSWNLVQPYTNAWDLPSMLIKPVQRVLKYPLLLNDLLRSTPPTHPDYANLTRAAREVKALADEINEVKRKREAVDSIIQGRSREVSGASVVTNSTTKSKRSVFSRKEKSEKGSPASSIKGAATAAKAGQPHASSSKPNPLGQFSMESHEELRRTEGTYAQLVQRFMDAENTAKKLAKIVGASGIKTREMWVIQDAVVEGWRRIINLNGLEPVEDIRIEAYRDVVYQILEGPCSAFDQKLLGSILPSFNGLLSLCKGPRTVILKRNSKHEDYNRLVKSSSLDKNKLPKEVLEGAQLFVALHHQLLLELPVLLDGFTRMLVLIRAAYADALAAFHAEVREKLRGFWVEYPPVVDDGAGEEASGTVADGQTIVRVWEEASAPTQEAVEEIPITKKISVRLIDAPVRIASGSATPLSHGISDVSNPKLGYPKGPLHLASNHSVASLASSASQSRMLSYANSSASSPTSSNLPQVPSHHEPHKASGFSFKRSNKSSTSSAALPSTAPHTAIRTARSTTNPLPSTPSTITSAPLSHSTSQRHSTLSDASSRDGGPTLSLLSFEGSDGAPADNGGFAENLIRRLSHPNESLEYEQEDGDRTLDGRERRRDPRSPQPDRSFGAPGEQEEDDGEGDGAEEVGSGLHHPYGVAASQQRMRATATLPVEEEEIELDFRYRCECVADFDLKGLQLDYMGYQFLNIVRGDVLDILYEVGRVDELSDFPLDVGLADDGLLIGRDARGNLGFVLCSFLHPKFDDEEGEDFQ